MINFGWAHIEGFGPIVNEDFFWGKRGLNIIQAPNGYGKTKFINALVWCLFGKPLSGSVTQWDHVQSSSYPGVKVSQEFEVDGEEIKVTRHQGYTKVKNALVVEVDGEEEDGDKRELQKLIEQKLGYSYDLFKASIVFGQKLKRIIAETGPNKKKVFDEAFEITYLPKALKIAKEKRTELNEESHNAHLGLVELQGHLSTCRATIQTQEDLIANFEQNKESEILAIRADIKSLRNTIREAEEQLGKLGNKEHLLHEKEIFEHDMYSDSDIREMEKDLARTESKLERAIQDRDDDREDKVAFTKSLDNLPEKCLECGKAYSRDDKEYQISQIKTNIKEVVIRIRNLNTTIKNLRGHISELKETISSAENASKTYNSIIKELEALEEKEIIISEAKKDISGLQKKIGITQAKQLDTNIEEKRIELTDLESQYKAQEKLCSKIQRELEAYDWVIKKPLSNAGLKAFIFNQMLDSINERLEFYTKYIGFQVAFFIDMQSANKDLETYVFKGDNPVPYDDLSGGQQQSVDIAVAFAIHDVVADSKSCSLLVMDEVFESLDKDNIEIMGEVIQDKAQGKCLYLVTHRAEFNPTNANIIQVLFDNGVTSLS